MRGFDMFGAEADSAVRIGRNRARGFEWNITFLVDLAFYDQLIVIAFHGQAFDGSILRRENVFIQHLRERFAAYGNLRRHQVKRERILVVENYDRSRLGWSEMSVQLNDVHGNPVGEVVRDIFHLELNGVRVRCCAGLSPARAWQIQQVEKNDGWDYVS
jgi:hypothetical protein